MTENRRPTPHDRSQEKQMIKEAKRGPTAVGQGKGEDESGADSARGMQTGAENDQTRTSEGKDTPSVEGRT
jgi:hypothetical protein